MPPPRTTTWPGCTPGVPARRTPRPPSGFSRKCAAACGASLPAISLIGASNGSRWSSVSTVSYATAAIPLSASARVSGSSAAMWRYVKSTRPSRSRAYSGSIGSLTLRRRSASPQTSSTEPMRAPARSYWSSANALPSPAVDSTTTSCPRWISSRAPAGVRATRYSSVLISLGTPMRKARRHYLSGAARRSRHRSAGDLRPAETVPAPFRRYRRSRGRRERLPALGWGLREWRLARTCRLRARPEVEQQPGERLRVLDLAEPRTDLLDGPAFELELLVGGGRGLAALDSLDHEQVHPLPAEPRRRPERRQLAPIAAGQPTLLLQLAPRGRQWLLPRLGRSRRQFQQPPPRRLAQLPNERHVSLGVHRHDGDRAGMLHDLALVLAPTLDREAEQPPVEDAARRVRLEAHARAVSTSATVTSTIASRSETATCSSGVWKPYTPCDRFTQRRPRSLKTFASAPPPESPKRGSIPQRANADAASATAGSSRFSR